MNSPRKTCCVSIDFVSKPMSHQAWLGFGEITERLENSVPGFPVQLAFEWNPATWFSFKYDDFMQYSDADIRAEVIDGSAPIALVGA